MEEQVQGRYNENHSMDDPVKLWNTMTSDRKAIVEMDTNYLINQLQGMRLEDHETVSAYVTAIGVVVNNLRVCNKPITEADR